MNTHAQQKDTVSRLVVSIKKLFPLIIIPTLEPISKLLRVSQLESKHQERLECVC